MKTPSAMASSRCTRLDNIMRLETACWSTRACPSPRLRTMLTRTSWRKRDVRVLNRDANEMIQHLCAEMTRRARSE